MPKASEKRTGLEPSSGPKTKKPIATSIDEAVGDLDRLAGHCSAAKTIADTIGNRFLSYMLAMTIREVEGLTRRRPNER